MEKLLITIAFCLFTAYGMNAQNIEGVWKTIDDETGKAKSYVTIFEKDGKYSGRISKILTPGKENAICDQCKDERKDQPINGMTIMTNVKKIDNNKYSGGKILDPQKGKEYDVTIIPQSTDMLLIKGGYKIFGKMVGRSQTWHRVN